MNLRMTPLFAESWSVAYRLKPPGSILTDHQTPFILIPNSSRYWAADPMVFEHEGRTYIFAELYDYARFRGIIGVTEFDGRHFGEWTPVLEEDSHMSYPFVFRQGDEIYMMPENRNGRCLNVYRAVEFPYRWERYRLVLKDVEWVDTTILPEGDGYIGFTESMAQPITDYRFRMDRDFTVTDCRPIAQSGDNVHRCGGPMFRYSGKLIRVTQDCVEDYGRALYFRCCDPQTLAEEFVQRLTPEQLNFDRKLFLQGMHTYSSSGDFEVIDVKTRRLTPRHFYHRFTGRIRRLLETHLPFHT